MCKKHYTSLSKKERVMIEKISVVNSTSSLTDNYKRKITQLASVETPTRSPACYIAATPLN